MTPAPVTSAVAPPVSAQRRIAMLCRVARRADRKLATLIMATLVLSAIAGAMQSLALKWIVDSATEQRWSFAVVGAILGGIGGGLLGSAGRAMGDAEHVVSNQVGLLVDKNSLELAASMPGIEHLERPEYLDQLALVRGGGPSLMRAVFTLTRSASLVISLVASLWLLGVVHPLLLATPLFAVPTAVLVPRSQRLVDHAKGVAAERQRAATQLHHLFLATGPAMELRLFGASERIDRRADDLWREVSNVQLKGAIKGAVLASVGWLALTGGYLAALLFTAWLALAGRATVGDIVLVSQLALLIRGNVAKTADAARQASAALRTADRFVWLEDLHVEQRAVYPGTSPVPAELANGITLDDVFFHYPGTETPVVRDVNVHLDAGSTVAIVGGNGAGKSTLVKLLTGMYRPTSGRILIDGVDLCAIDIEAWRRSTSAAFQDYLRPEATALTIVGLGDPEGLDDIDRINQAVDRGGARTVIDQLADGLDTHVGKFYADGAELSGGEWQRLAIARSSMPVSPLCLLLDEPTAALDPEAEQRVFDSYRDAARNSAGRGAITILVSHRFSSVRMADIILVLNNGTITERGTHQQLIEANGHYATMYRTQASAYT